MSVDKKRNTSFVLARILYTLLFIIIQVAILVVVFLFFKDEFAYFYAICVLLSIAATMHILNDESTPEYKIAWLIPILLLPIFGGLLYIMFGNYRMGKDNEKLKSGLQKEIKYLVYNGNDVLEKLKEENKDAALQSQYILNAAGSFPCNRTQTKYFPVGEKMFSEMLKELESAKSFIFMEYFIINEGVMWNKVLEILERKAKEGLDVRVIYDDFGCMFTLPRSYWKTLQKKGIKACVFNPFDSILSSRFNNRDHRKICVIDGNVAFTGGINLADEYINEIERFGHWKDTGIMLKGKAVWSFTIQFLAMWDFVTKEKDNFRNYEPNEEFVKSISSDGYVQGYTDVPLDKEFIGRTVYSNLINRAKEYVYIMTPYLILDNQMMEALCTSAKSGVDVRIITPHIPDKKIVFFVTRSYYDQLIEAGVKIYEYTPGFIHAKSMVCDDKYGIVGTINMDYRSLYLHVECAVWMYENSAVMDMKNDFIETQEKSQSIALNEVVENNMLNRIFRAVLRAFSPLM